MQSAWNCQLLPTSGVVRFHCRGLYLSDSHGFTGGFNKPCGLVPSPRSLRPPRFLRHHPRDGHLLESSMKLTSIHQFRHCTQQHTAQNSRAHSATWTPASTSGRQKMRATSPLELRAGAALPQLYVLRCRPTPVHDKGT